MQDPAVKQLISVLLADQRTRYSGGIERFLRLLSTKEGQESWKKWRDNEVTRLFLDAMKALAETGAAGVDTNPTGLALSHGVMCGVNMAVRMCEDPTRVFPSIFDGEDSLMSKQVSQTVDPDYNTPPVGEEGVMDSGN